MYIVRVLGTAGWSTSLAEEVRDMIRPCDQYGTGDDDQIPITATTAAAAAAASAKR